MEIPSIPVGGPVKVWRYHHFHSNAPFLQKRATLTACLKKVHAMASDAGMLKASALDKVAEFGSWRMEIQIRV